MTLHQSIPARSGCGSGLSREVVAWRLHRLREAGFGPDTAACLAYDEGFDLHALLELVDRGCPPPLAVRLLAPLPTGPAS